MPHTGPEAEGRVGRRPLGGEGHTRRVQLRRVGVVQPQGDGDGVHLVPEGDGAKHCHSPAAAPGLRAPRRVVEDPIVLREPGERGDYRGHRMATSNRGGCADWRSGAGRRPGPPLSSRVLHTAMARKHPRMGVLDLESGGRQGHHMGGMVWQMAVRGQVDGDAALVA